MSDNGLTPAQLKALRVLLREGSLWYWAWRGSCRPWRFDWPDKLRNAGCIDIIDNRVILTEYGRSVLEQ